MEKLLLAHVSYSGRLPVIRSHPTDHLLVGYATGVLPAPAGLVIAAHAEACRACDARIRQIEQVNGDLLASLPKASLAPDALARILDKIERVPLETKRQPTPSSADVPIPAAVARFGLAPRRWINPSLWIAHVRAPRADGWRAYLVGGAPNARIPAHTHNGMELISVLLGAYRDGQTYSQGDFAQKERGTEHTQQVGPHEACVCLVASGAPARWRGAAKFIAPLIDI